MDFFKRNNLSKIAITAAAVGVALNMVLWIGATSLLTSRANKATWDMPKAGQEKQVDTQKLRPGKDSAQAASISWISYDAFEDLLAKNNKTKQAAFQDKVKPVKQAPVRIKKLTEAKPTKKAQPKKRQPAKHQPKDKKKQVANAAVKTASKNQKAADQKTKKQKQDIEKVLRNWLSSRINKLLQTSALNPAAATTVKKTSPNQTTTATPTNTNAKPTSVPKSDSESPPASFVKAVHQIQLGKVVAGPGIEIITKVPDFSPVTKASSIPRPMQVEITFDETGDVTEAKITRSSTYPNFDSAVLSSLYRWRATGKKMKKINTSFTMQFTLLW